jgi:drug/metabolite transporter (DMT)-like permease
MPAWLLYSLGYLLMVGANGFVTKWALRSVPWPTLMVATTLAYAVLVVFAALRGWIQVPSLTWQSGVAVALVGVFMAGSFLAMVLALERGSASQVIPSSR